MTQRLIDIAVAFWATLGEMAPWLIFGFLAAGVLSVFFSPAFIERHLGGRGFWPVVKASVLGVPLPICSCGVIPVSASLYRHGASRGATSSFLLSTPQTGVDSIFATYALMGPVFAVARPVIALLNGIFGGLLIDLADPDRRSLDAAGAASESKSASAPAPVLASESSSPCCSSAAQAKASPQAATSCGAGSCCDTEAPPADQPKWRQALRYGLVTLPADLAVALLIGLVVAAVLTAMLPADALAPFLGGGLLAMVAAVLVGTPLYICSTASIPVALGLIAAGASPGAVLAFLIAGPATNAATVSVTWNVLGRRTGLLYLLSVAVTAVVAGLMLDSVFTLETLRLPAGAFTQHEHAMTWQSHAWALAMLVLLAPALWSRLRPMPTTTTADDSLTAPPADSLGSSTKPASASDPHRLRVTGLHCSHCVDAVQRGLREVAGVGEVSLDLRSGLAVVHGKSIDAAALADAVEALGYGAEHAPDPSALQSPA